MPRTWAALVLLPLYFLIMESIIESLLPPVSLPVPSRLRLLLSKKSNKTASGSRNNGKTIEVVRLQRIGIKPDQGILDGVF